MVCLCSRIEWCIEICVVFKMTPASFMKRVKANGASLMSNFCRASLKMAWLNVYSELQMNRLKSKIVKQGVALAVKFSIYTW